MKYTLNKAITIGLLTGSTVFANETFETNYNVSRNGVDVKYVFQISA
jgi:hypothetical protein